MSARILKELDLKDPWSFLHHFVLKYIIVPKFCGSFNFLSVSDDGLKVPVNGRVEINTSEFEIELLTCLLCSSLTLSTLLCPIVLHVIVMHTSPCTNLNVNIHRMTFIMKICI